MVRETSTVITDGLRCVVTMINENTAKTENMIAESVAKLTDGVTKINENVETTTKLIVEDVDTLTNTVKQRGVIIEKLHEENTAIVSTMEALTSAIEQAPHPQSEREEEGTVETLRTTLAERDWQIQALTQDNTALVEKVSSMESKVDELIGLVRNLQGSSFEVQRRMNTFSPMVTSALQQQRQVNEQLTTRLGRQEEKTERNATAVNRQATTLGQLESRVQKNTATAQTAKTTATEAMRRMNTATPSLNNRLDEQAEQLSRARRRINANVGELQGFALETEQRIDSIERQLKNDKAAVEGADLGACRDKAQIHT